jgi:hypothetical protein
MTRKLSPQVQRPVRIRGRHVVIGGIVVAWATVALAHKLRETEYPKRTVARAAEAKFLDSLEERSLQTCPTGPDTHDPWGEPYRVLCHEDGGLLQVIVLSYGDGQAIVDSRTYPE